MRLTAILLGCSMGVSITPAAPAQTPAKTDKVDIVAVTGCLRENPANTWMLVNATDPAPSNANAPSPKEIASAPKAGKNEFRLIGVAEFNLPAHRDHIVLVKGLHIKATPTSRLNVTSVTMVAPSCETAPKGPAALH
jgi:hypothetical protein